jgi:hypothetical protein
MNVDKNKKCSGGAFPIVPIAMAIGPALMGLSSLIKSLRGEGLKKDTIKHLNKHSDKIGLDKVFDFMQESTHNGHDFNDIEDELIDLLKSSTIKAIKFELVNDKDKKYYEVGEISESDECVQCENESDECVQCESESDEHYNGGSSCPKQHKKIKKVKKVKRGGKLNNQLMMYQQRLNEYRKQNPNISYRQAQQDVKNMK